MLFSCGLARRTHQQYTTILEVFRGGSCTSKKNLGLRLETEINILRGFEVSTKTRNCAKCRVTKSKFKPAMSRTANAHDVLSAKLSLLIQQSYKKMVGTADNREAGFSRERAPGNGKAQVDSRKAKTDSRLSLFALPVQWFTKIQIPRKKLAIQRPTIKMSCTCSIPGRIHKAETRLLKMG